MISRIVGYEEAVRPHLPGLVNLHATLTQATQHRFVTEAWVQNWLRYVTKRHEVFTTFKTERGEWFETNYAEPSAVLDAAILSLVAIKDGLQVKLDALEAEEESVAEMPLPESREHDSTDEHGNKIYEKRPFNLDEVMARIPQEIDAFSGAVMDIIRSELEDVPAPVSPWSS